MQFHEISRKTARLEKGQNLEAGAAGILKKTATCEIWVLVLERGFVALVRKVTVGSEFEAGLRGKGVGLWRGAAFFRESYVTGAVESFFGHLCADVFGGGGERVVVTLTGERWATLTGII
ncbi:UNVERIFIED_CONTAM: hypothetical protein Sindi_1069600 [Sesamum indicum]